MTLKIEGLISGALPGNIEMRTPVTAGKLVDPTVALGQSVMAGPGEEDDKELWGGEDPGGHGITA